MTVGDLRVILDGYEDTSAVIFTIEDEYGSFTISEVSEDFEGFAPHLELTGTLPHGFSIYEE